MKYSDYLHLCASDIRFHFYHFRECLYLSFSVFFPPLLYLLPNWSISPNRENVDYLWLEWERPLQKLNPIRTLK